MAAEDGAEDIRYHCSVATDEASVIVTDAPPSPRWQPCIVAPLKSHLRVRQPPHNLEAEQALLGAILVKNEALDRVSGFLSPDHFFDPLHGKIYETLATLIHAGKTATPITVKTFFENVEPIGSTLTVRQYLGRLAANATTVINAAEYGRTVYDLAERRALIIIGEDMVDTAWDSAVGHSPIDQAEEASGRLARLISSSVETRRRVFTIDDIEVSAKPYVWKGVITGGDVGFLYAVSQAGKGFFVNEITRHVVLGTSLLGRRTKGAPVLQIQYEGQENLRKRVEALRNELIGDEVETFRRRFRWAEGAFLGRGVGGDRGEARIIRDAKELQSSSGQTVALITIDTVSKAIAGETTKDDDVIAALYQRGSRIASATGAAVMFVTHPGHTEKSRPAGSYQIIGSPDFLLTITLDGQSDSDISVPVTALRTVSLPKVKDGACGITLGSYTLSVVDLCVDEDGEPRTSCVVEWRDIDCMTQRSARRTISPQHRKALDELNELLLGNHFSIARGHCRAPEGARLISRDAWKDACEVRMLSETGESEAERKAFARAVEALEKSGYIGTFGKDVWLLLTPHSNS